MPYVLPAMLDAVPRSLRAPGLTAPGLTAAERAANSSAAPLPGVPRRSRTPANNPANVRLTLFPQTPSNEPPTSARDPSPGSSREATMIATLASPTALLHVSSSTPLPRVALGPRSRRVRPRESCESLNSSVAFPSSPAPDVLADRANYVLAPADEPPKHVPVTPGKNGTLRLSMDAIRAGMRRSNSIDATKAEDKTAATPSSTSSFGLRKKSGELVKPSLKHAHTLSGGFPTQAKLSRSAPATPTTPKFVHFDAQLEHVRLFLAEQKPTAVSRDGSPVDTSEGEGNEFPWAGRGNSYYHSSDDERARKAVRIKNTTVPVTASIDGADVRLQSLVLAEDGASLVGRVLVRNIAFEKWVAVRFTFDWWQTTSEVSARYLETVASGIDCFGFTIKLGDVLHRIEEKTLFVAVRYTVAGREIWDSNNNQNYMVSFTKEEEKRPAPVAQQNSWSNGWPSKSRSQMNDLRKSLEKAIQDDDDERIPQLQIKPRPRPNVRGMSFGGFESKPTVTSIVAPAQPAPKFGARYDFGAAPRERPSADSFRMPALGADSFKRCEAPKTETAKRPVVSTEVKAAFDPKMCQSPRDLEDTLRLQMAPVEPLVPSPGGFDLAPAAVPQTGRRHHHRAAYFDAWSFPAPGVKRTSSGGPNVEELATADQSSIPASWMEVTEPGGSIASTPSITSSSSPSQSPSSPPEYLPSPEFDDSLIGRPDVDPSNYNSFLDRFCFFTGPANERRTHTRSSSDSSLYGFGPDPTAQTLRAVSSSLSSNSALSLSSGSDVAVTPRAGTPVGLEAPLPAMVAPVLN